MNRMTELLLPAAPKLTENATHREQVEGAQSVSVSCEQTHDNLSVQ
jgi:hypothetical protein